MRLMTESNDCGENPVTNMNHFGTDVDGVAINLKGKFTPKLSRSK